MKNPRVAIVYFSATDVTHGYARTVQDRLAEQGCAVDAYNVTAFASRGKPLVFESYDGVIFGFPVFDFAPSVINEWLPTLKGEGKKSAMFFTYGGRTTGYAHFHTKLLLEKAGFQVLFSGEFLGKHSFNVGGWPLLSKRPDAGDLEAAREYADLAVERFSMDSPSPFRLQKPFGYNQVTASLENQPKRTERTWKNPVRTAAECSMCRECEDECPAGAFDAEAGVSNPATCICCMRCVHICPDKVIHVDQMKDIYEPFLTIWNVTENMMNAKKSKIITESWQASS